MGNSEINETQQLQIAARLCKARDEERLRISRDIHDEVGQLLTAIKLDLHELIRLLPEKNEAAVQYAESAMSLLDRTFTSVRKIASGMRPDLVAGKGLRGAIQILTQDFQARTGVICNVQFEMDGSSLSVDVETALYRILQEALTNVARHAHASRVEVRLDTPPGRVELSVCDDGVGYVVGAETTKGSLGLIGMKERALALGGRFSIRGLTNKGTVVSVILPTN